MSRRTLIFIAIALILLSLGGYFYFRKVPTSPVTPTPQFPGEGQPIMGGGGVTPTPEEAGGEVFVPGVSTTLPRLYELHKVPVAGVTVVETKDRKGAITSIAARYIERSLGHIYETPLTSLVETRTANDTHTRLSEALWGNNGKSVVIRFLDNQDNQTIKTHILNLGAQSTSNGFVQTEEIILPDSIPFMATAEDNTDRVFFFENGFLGAVGSTITSKNTARATIFTSTFTEWLPQFPNKDLVTVTTRPASSVPGHLFFINPTTKAVSKILSNINGLTTLTSRDGKSILFTESIGQGVELSIYDVAKKEARPLTIQTLPEKCVWSNKNLTIVYCAVPQTLPFALYPDQWYQGLVPFSDALWRIDTKTGATEQITVLAFDAINLSLSSNDSYVLFMNKATGTPWVYRIAEEAPVISTSPTTPSTGSSATTTAGAPISPSPTEGLTKIK